MYVFKRILTIQKPTTNKKNQQNKQKKLRSENKILYFTRKTIL